MPNISQPAGARNESFLLVASGSSCLAKTLSLPSPSLVVQEGPDAEVSCLCPMLWNICKLLISLLPHPDSSGLLHPQHGQGAAPAAPASLPWTQSSAASPAWTRIQESTTKLDSFIFQQQLLHLLWQLWGWLMAQLEHHHCWFCIPAVFLFSCSPLPLLILLPLPSLSHHLSLFFSPLPAPHHPSLCSPSLLLRRRSIYWEC